ncbi:hypothetical protein BH23ACT10_BH23ACT10_10640 [soil metagenome]
MFASDSSLNGEDRGSAPDVDAAFNGDPTSNLKTTGDGAQLEVLVPIRRGVGDGSHPVVAVYKVQLPYSATQAAVAADVRSLRLSLGGGLAIVWIALLRLELVAAGRLRNEARHRWMAHHDALTELPNRVQFKQRLELLDERCRTGAVPQSC